MICVLRSIYIYMLCVDYTHIHTYLQVLRVCVCVCMWLGDVYSRVCVCISNEYNIIVCCRGFVVRSFWVIFAVLILVWWARGGEGRYRNTHNNNNKTVGLYYNKDTHNTNRINNQKVWIFVLIILLCQFIVRNCSISQMGRSHSPHRIHPREEDGGGARVLV